MQNSKDQCFLTVLGFLEISIHKFDYLTHFVNHKGELFVAAQGNEMPSRPISRGNFTARQSSDVNHCQHAALDTDHSEDGIRSVRQGCGFAPFRDSCNVVGENPEPK